jgi:hypothetical protein
MRDDLDALSNEHRKEMFQNRSPANVRWVGLTLLAVDWQTPADPKKLLSHPYLDRMGIAVLPDRDIIGFALHKTVNDTYEYYLINEDNPLVQWFLLVSDSCDRGSGGISREQIGRLGGLLLDPVGYGGLHLEALARYLDEWRRLPTLAPELKPPSLVLTEDMFKLMPTPVNRRYRG